MRRYSLRTCPCGRRMKGGHLTCSTCRMRTYRAKRQPIPDDLTAAEIEARLAVNDAEIRRTRPFTVELGWSSPLSRLR